jgi:hypothetical protein
MELLEFRGTERWSGSHPLICVGPSEEVFGLIDDVELRSLLGAFAVYRDERTRENFVGVWGHRKIGTFRRLLRERGAAGTIVREKPPLLRMIATGVRLSPR